MPCPGSAMKRYRRKLQKTDQGRRQGNASASYLPEDRYVAGRVLYEDFWGKSLSIRVYADSAFPAGRRR